jgi:hypothetical protein
MVPVSLRASLVVEGMFVIRGSRGLLPVEHACQNPVFTPPSPEHAPIQASSDRT